MRRASDDRLFHGPLGNEHFEIDVGRNIGVSGTRCSFSRSLDWGIPSGLFPKAWFGVPTSVARSQIPPGRVLCGLPPPLVGGLDRHDGGITSVANVGVAVLARPGRCQHLRPPARQHRSRATQQPGDNAHI